MLMERSPKLSDPEEFQNIILMETREPDLELRKLDARLISEKSVRVISVGVLTLIGILVVSGLASIIIAEIYKVPTDVIERLLTPTVIGLVGIFGGLHAAGNSR